MSESSNTPVFKDQNFKLAIINALIEIGHFGDIVEEIQANSEFSGDGIYYENLEGEDWYGPHPEVLERILEIPLTWQQLDRIKKLSPDAGDDLYTLISPNWDGEDDQFLASSVEDIAMLKNLEEFSFFHTLKLKDYSPLISAPKLVRILLPTMGYVDGSENADFLKQLSDKGVEIELINPEKDADTKHLDVLKFDQTKPRVLLFHLDDVPEYSGINFDDFDMIPSIRQSPFYLFDPAFEKIDIQFPEEADSADAENEAGFAAAKRVATDFISSTFGVTYLFNCKGDNFNYVPAFVHNVDIDLVSKAFEEAGFEVFSMEEYLDL